MRLISGPIAIALGALLLAGCADAGGDAASTESAAPEKPTIVTDMYPTTFAVEQVAGKSVNVIQLTPPGVEPHDYELTPKQVAQIADADLVFYLPGMIPAVTDAIAQEAPERARDITEGITRLNGDAGDSHSPSGDPHVWLDPANMSTMGINAARAVSGIGVSADSRPLTKAMFDLDKVLGAQLSPCAIETMVVSHEAFGYLAAAYGFTQVGIAGLSPQTEPSPAKLAEISTLVEDQGVTTIYFESLASPDAAKAIAAETGTVTAKLDPIEGNTKHAGYPKIMEANGATLSAGQSCS